MLASALAGRWGVAAASLSYRPVGFGSHHWEVVDRERTRWFLTADDLDTKRLTRRPHPGSQDDTTWRVLRSLVDRIGGGGDG